MGRRRGGRRGAVGCGRLSRHGGKWRNGRPWRWRGKGNRVFRGRRGRGIDIGAGGGMPAPAGETACRRERARPEHQPKRQDAQERAPKGTRGMQAPTLPPRAITQWRDRKVRLRRRIGGREAEWSVGWLPSASIWRTQVGRLLGPRTALVVGEEPPRPGIEPGRALLRPPRRTLCWTLRWPLGRPVPWAVFWPLPRLPLLSLRARRSGRLPHPVILP